METLTEQVDSVVVLLPLVHQPLPLQTQVVVLGVLETQAAQQETVAPVLSLLNTNIPHQYHPHLSLNHLVFGSAPRT